MRHAIHMHQECNTIRQILQLKVTGISAQGQLPFQTERLGRLSAAVASADADQQYWQGPYIGEGWTLPLVCL